MTPSPVKSIVIEASIAGSSGRSECGWNCGTARTWMICTYVSKITDIQRCFTEIMGLEIVSFKKKAIVLCFLELPRSSSILVVHKMLLAMQQQF